MLKRSKKTNSVKTAQAWGYAACAFLVAMTVNLTNIDHTGFYDEFYHVLAAQSWLENGTFSIGDGVYTRSSHYTVLIALVSRFFGDSLVAARMISALASALLITLVYIWTERVSNRTAAILSAALLCLCPINLFLSQLVRFYAIQALLFWIGLVAVYQLTSAPIRTWRNLALAIAALACFFSALSLQVTTLIGIAALAAWAVPAFFYRCWREELLPRQIIVGASVVILTVVLLSPVLIKIDFLQPLFSAFRSSPQWAEHGKDSLLFYHWWFLNNYPTLWALLPLIILGACAVSPRPAIFCAVIFLTVIVVHSFGGTKGGRYIAYALPLFFILNGIALSGGLVWFRRLLLRVQKAVFREPSSNLANRVIQPIGLLVIAAFIYASNPAFRTTFKMLSLDDEQWPSDSPAYRGQSNWERASPALKEIAEGSSVVIASAGVKALYYLERLDFDLSATNVGEYQGEFRKDDRTGAVLVSTADALRTIYGCYETGMVIVEDRHWRNEWAVPSSTADFLESKTERVDFEPDLGLIVFVWKQSDEDDIRDCSDNEYFSGDVQEDSVD
jgi:hypothetical protein